MRLDLHVGPTQLRFFLEERNVSTGSVCFRIDWPPAEGLTRQETF